MSTSLTRLAAGIAAVSFFIAPAFAETSASVGARGKVRAEANVQVNCGVLKTNCLIRKGVKPSQREAKKKAKAIIRRSDSSVRVRMEMKRKMEMERKMKTGTGATKSE